jgi:hypothetical protein
MLPKNPLVIRQLRSTVLIALFICILLLGVGSLTLSGPFHFITIAFLVFVTAILLFVLWGSSFVTIFNAMGLQGKSFLTRWQYPWDQIESWGLDDLTMGSSIWFKATGSEQRRTIQALGEDQSADVRAYFQQYCGDPQTQDVHSEQPAAPDKKEDK